MTRGRRTVGTLVLTIAASAGMFAISAALASPASASNCGDHYGAVMPGAVVEACPTTAPVTPEPVVTPDLVVTPDPVITPDPVVNPEPAPAPVAAAPESEPAAAPAAAPVVRSARQAAVAAAPAEAAPAVEVASAPVASAPTPTASVSVVRQAAVPTCTPLKEDGSVLPGVLGAVAFALLGAAGALRAFMATGHKWPAKVRRVLAGPDHHHLLDPEPAEDPEASDVA